MTDYISREAASLVLAEYGEKAVFAYTDLIRAMAKIPAADVVERKRGSWQWRTIENDFPQPYGQYECSRCGYPEPRTEVANYCPNCGARMVNDDV